MKSKIHFPRTVTKAGYSPTWLLLVFVFLTSASRAEIPTNDLFIEAEATAEMLGTVDPTIVLRQRGVSLAQDALSPQSELVFINLFENVFLTAELDHVETSSGGTWAWIGKVQGESDSEVTFVVNNGNVSGTITLPDLCYHIRPLQSGLHVIREIDVAALQDTLDSASPTGSSEPQLVENAQFEGQPVFLQTFQLNSQPFLPEEQEVFTLLNQERAVQGLHLLAADTALIAAARAHSQDMSQNNYFSHTNLQGKSAGQRMLEAGYSLNAWGENIAAGFTTPASVMNAWMNSPGHRANILGASFCDVGAVMKAKVATGHRILAVNKGYSLVLIHKPQPILLRIQSIPIRHPIQLPRRLNPRLTQAMTCPMGKQKHSHWPKTKPWSMSFKSRRIR